MTGSGRDRGPVGAMLGPGEPEVGCDECFELLDRYVDLELAGEDAAARMPRVHAHFEGCPVCRDEHESLLALVASHGQDDFPG